MSVFPASCFSVCARLSACLVEINDISFGNPFGQCWVPCQFPGLWLALTAHNWLLIGGLYLYHKLKTGPSQASCPCSSLIVWTPFTSCNCEYDETFAVKIWCTAYHSKLCRPWLDILIGYNSLHIDPRIKSMGCFEKFMKFSVW